MVSVYNCIVTQHDLSLVALAAIVCIAGSIASVRIFLRACASEGMQRHAWLCIDGVTVGTTIWCTHFVAMLSFDARVPVDIAPLTTGFSLIVAIVGGTLAVSLAAGRWYRWLPEFGGALLGATIATMHYLGMAAYRIEGLVDWHAGLFATSIVLSIGFGALALNRVLRPLTNWCKYGGATSLVLAILSLHFFGMSAMSITPLPGLPPGTDMVGLAPHVALPLAAAIAGAALLVIGIALMSFLIDSEARTTAEETIYRIARLDGLTGLPNRSGLLQSLEQDIIRVEGTDRKVVAVMLDLEALAAINDELGHAAGDMVLAEYGRRLEQVAEHGETIGRIGGDEFVAIKVCRSEVEMRDFTSRIIGAIAAPIELNGHDRAISASLGVAAFPDDAESRDVLLDHASLALARAKRDPTTSVCFYDSTMDEASRRRRNLARDLKTAIGNDELDVAYQVQLDTATLAITGYEALLRWRHPQRGNVPPSEFIPVAEESGIVMEIGEWVLRRACRDAANWPRTQRVAVNLSPVQFAHPDLPGLIAEVLEESGLAPENLEVEVTESMLISDRDRALESLQGIKSLGVGVAMDDFGVGYSSLDTLRTIPFDKIKLDRSFIWDFAGDDQVKAIIRAVLAMGKSLGIKILAEGVDDEAQLEFLREEGCDLAQGFLLGRPKPNEDVVRELEAPQCGSARPRRAA